MCSLVHRRAEEGDASAELTMADFRYYLQRREEKLYDIDHEEIKEYFPLRTASGGVFRWQHIYFQIHISFFVLHIDCCHSQVAQMVDFQSNGWLSKVIPTSMMSERMDISKRRVYPFFSTHQVVDGMLSIYQTLLSLKFELLERPHVWHEEVQMYRVTDARPASVYSSDTALLSKPSLFWFTIVDRQ